MQIPDHWRWTTIAEVQSSEKRATITGPFGSSIGKKFFVESGVPVIRGNNLSLRADKFIDEGFVFISEGKAEELRGYKAFKNDLIFTAAGTIGQVGIIPEKTKYEFYIISNKQMRARFNTETVDPTFAYYWFSSPWMVDYIKRHDTGSTIPLINLGVLRSLPMPLPPITEQISISQYIGAIDKKINNNKNINKTLEQMAQALFKSWFVDFEPVKAKIAVLEAGGSQDESTLAAMATISGKDADSLAIFEQEQPEKFAELKATAELFPSAMQDSELGGIPKDWCIKTYDQFCDFVQSGGTPKRSEPAYWENGCIKWLSSGEVRGKIVLDTKEKITNAGLNNSSAKLWPKHSTVMAMYGATAGEICLLAEDMSANQACCALHSINSPFFTYFSLCNISTEISSKASGSAQQNLNKGIISETKICIPNDNILSDYENKIHSIMMAWISNVKLSRELSVLRNTLLPKLLSGEITLPEVEQAVSEAENV